MERKKIYNLIGLFIAIFLTGIVIEMNVFFCGFVIHGAVFFVGCDHGRISAVVVNFIHNNLLGVL